MPYITKDRRDELADGCTPCNCGDLNYLLTKAILEHTWEHTWDKSANVKPLSEKLLTRCLAYIEQNELRYQSINDVMGALACCGFELRRRLPGSTDWEQIVYPATLLLSCVASEFYKTIAVPYEDKKISENGDMPYERK